MNKQELPIQQISDYPEEVLFTSIPVIQLNGDISYTNKLTVNDIIYIEMASKNIDKATVITLLRNAFIIDTRNLLYTLITNINSIIINDYININSCAFELYNSVISNTFDILDFDNLIDSNNYMVDVNKHMSSLSFIIHDATMRIFISNNINELRFAEFQEDLTNIYIAYHDALLYILGRHLYKLKYLDSIIV